MPLYFPLFLFILIATCVVMGSGRTRKDDPKEDDRLARLSERVRTLEAIILDRDRRLRDDIDRLR